MAIEDSSDRMSAALTPGTNFILTSLSPFGTAHNNHYTNCRNNRSRDCKDNPDRYISIIFQIVLDRCSVEFSSLALPLIVHTVYGCHAVRTHQGDATSAPTTGRPIVCVTRRLVRSPYLSDKIPWRCFLLPRNPRYRPPPAAVAEGRSAAI